MKKIRDLSFYKHHFVLLTFEGFVLQWDFSYVKKYNLLFISHHKWLRSGSFTSLIIFKSMLISQSLNGLAGAFTRTYYIYKGRRCGSAEVR
jgi:hypothetical protein